MLTRAIQWAEVVHFMVPFPLSIRGRKIAESLGVAYTAAFHVQPENVTYSIGLGRCHAINTFIYGIFRRHFYRNVEHIHCPSRFIAGELVKNGYKAKLHVISNGIDPDFVYRKIDKPQELKDKFVILMVGRLSNEKRQDVLIKALKLSKHTDRLQLILAGQGPRHDYLAKLAQGLKNKIIINFYSKSELMDIIAYSDLYVHAADAEIEAMSCMEAFAGGLVPVIANSDCSATPQFALDNRSLFVAGDSADLARKIDYWIEHEDERREMEYKYAELGKKYNIDSCVSQTEEMFRQAIEENAR